MKRAQLAELKRQHQFSAGPGGDRSACSCGWDHGYRVGSLSVGRERHRAHVREVVELAAGAGP